MALPERIRVKISSEEAESVSLTPVVVQEMPVRELIGAMLGATGKDAARIAELLARGAFVSGGSRFRWDKIEPGAAAVEAVLATFPDPDPSRAFVAGGCVCVFLKGASARVEITREAGSARRLLARGSFWDALMGIASAAAPAYAGYSYKHAADRFVMEVSSEIGGRLRECAPMLRYSSLEAQVLRGRFEQVEFLVERG